MNTPFKVGDRVLVVGLNLPDNVHLNGKETVVSGIIGRDEAARILGFEHFAEKGSQNEVFYILDDFVMVVKYTGYLGSEGYKHIGFVGGDNLRKIYPKADETFDEMVKNIKNEIHEMA